MDPEETSSIYARISDLNDQLVVGTSAIRNAYSALVLGQRQARILLYMLVQLFSLCLQVAQATT